MASIGDMLREAREAQGRSVADLASELCITEHYLHALERDDIQSLPGLFFYQSFARQYAAMLGLERSQVDKALAEISGPGEAAEDASAGLSSEQRVSPATASTYVPAHRSLDPIVEGTNRKYFAGYPIGLSAAALVAAVVLGSGIFAWWNRAPQAFSSAEPGNGVGLPVNRSSAMPVAAAGLSATASVDKANEVVLNLSATEETWLSITSHGKVIFSGTLQPSESKTLNGGEVATMKIGNAGGVTIQWNGKSIGTIGPRGQVRTIRFTRQDFHVLSPEDEAPTEQAPVDPVRHEL
jgi:transcriptional regulator with XRE-family HTH domain